MEGRTIEIYVNGKKKAHNNQGSDEADAETGASARCDPLLRALAAGLSVVLLVDVGRLQLGFCFLMVLASASTRRTVGIDRWLETDP